MDWTALLLEQLTFHWDVQARPRLNGLTDDEYRWEPVPDCWSVRPRADTTAPMAAGAGDQVIEFALPAPDPPPVTTIAWRLGHVSVGVFAMRNANHFGGPPIDYASVDWPATAQGGLALLDDSYRGWIEGVRSLDADALARPVGETEGPYAQLPYAALVLHIHREAIHHLAEVALLRDLYRRR